MVFGQKSVGSYLMQRSGPPTRTSSRAMQKWRPQTWKARISSRSSDPVAVYCRSLTLHHYEVLPDRWRERRKHWSRVDTFLSVWATQDPPIITCATRTTALLPKLHVVASSCCGIGRRDCSFVPFGPVPTPDCLPWWCSLIGPPNLVASRGGSRF